LSGSGFFPRTDGREGKHAAGAHSEHAADNALFAHADPDQRTIVSFAAEELIMETLSESVAAVLTTL